MKPITAPAGAESPEMKGSMSVTEAAEYLGVSRTRVHELIQLGRLKAERLGGAGYILRTKDVEFHKAEGMRSGPKGGRPPKQP